jgi:GH18 family chitinase
MVYGSNEWISYDDAQSSKNKLAYQSSRCLKGLMIWSLDLDSNDFQAMNALFGEDAMADTPGDTSLKLEEKTQLVEDLAAYTGQNCYVTVACTAGGNDHSDLSTCVTGYIFVEVAHAPWQI